jgi:hypothetical protein
MLRLQLASRSEGDGFAFDVTHAQSLSDANTELVAIRPGRRPRRSAHARDSCKAFLGSPSIVRLTTLPTQRRSPVGGNAEVDA